MTGVSVLCSQELTKREVVDVTHLEVPAELAGLLEVAAGKRSFPTEGWVGAAGNGPVAIQATSKVSFTSTVLLSLWTIPWGVHPRLPC